MTTLPKARFAVLVCLVGGLLSLVNFAALDSLLEPREPLLGAKTISLVKSIFWLLVSLCLAGGSLGLLMLNKAKAGWRNLLVSIGLVATVFGAVAYLIGGVYVFVFLVEQYNDFLRQAQLLLINGRSQ